MVKLREERLRMKRCDGSDGKAEDSELRPWFKPPIDKLNYCSEEVVDRKDRGWVKLKKP